MDKLTEVRETAKLDAVIDAIEYAVTHFSQRDIMSKHGFVARHERYFGDEARERLRVALRGLMG